MSSSGLLRLSRRLLRTFSSSSSAASNLIPNPTNSISNPKSQTTLDATINKLFHERNPEKLFSAFKLASESYRFRCRHKIYSSTVRRLSSAGRLDLVRDLLDDQKRYPELARSEGFALRLLSLYGAASLPLDAAKTFEELPSLQCPRSVKSFNALLTAFLDSKSFDQLADAFEQIPISDPSIVPDLFSYNILIQALCEKSNLDAALRTLQFMETNGIAPDLVSFNSLLNGFYRNGDFEGAEKVWDLMAERKVEPNTKCFNAKIRGLVSAGRIAEAEKVVGELEKADVYSFNALIKGYCEHGMLEDAKKVFEDLPKKECAPNKATFEVLLRKLIETGELDLALRLCNESMSRRCYLDAGMLQKVVDGLVEGSREEEAKKLVELARKHSYSRKSLSLKRSSPSNLSSVFIST